MYQTFLSRALVALAITGGAFLLGRVLAHSTGPDASLTAEECELALESPPTACAEDCRYRSLPDAPALPEAEPETEAPLVIASNAETQPAAPPAIRADEVIVVPAPAAAPEAVETTAVVSWPKGEVADSANECPAFMPYINDEPRAATRRRCPIEDFFGPDANDPSEEAEVPAAPARQPKGVPSISRYEPAKPAQVDTMEFRPTDARRGDFQPHQL